MACTSQLGVASLVRQRGCGEISRDEFFERLAQLQSASASYQCQNSCSAESLNRLSNNLASPMPSQQLRAPHVPGRYRGDDHHMLPSHHLDWASGPGSNAAQSDDDRSHLLMNGLLDRRWPLADDGWSDIGFESLPVSRDEPVKVPSHEFQQAARLRVPELPDSPNATSEWQSSVCPVSPGEHSYPLEMGDQNTLDESSIDLLSFAQRNDLWDHQRERRCEEMRRHRDQQEVAECSFQPNLSLTSKASASGVHRAAATTKTSSANALAISERLFTATSRTPRFSRVTAQQVQEREAQLAQECTFRPNITQTSAKYRPRAASTTALGGRGSETSSAELPSGADALSGRSRASVGNASQTFKPQTNSVPATMVNARAYLSDNVFNRLSQRVTEDESRDDIIAESAIDTFGADRSSLLSRSRSDTGLPGAVVSFLHRQVAHEEDRRERRELLDFAYTDSHSPEINDRSRRLVERKRMFDEDPSVLFEEKKPLSQQERVDPECTFKPSVSATAKERPARTAVQLTKWLTEDAPRLQNTHLATTRKRQEKEETKELTFKPMVMERDGIQSRLGVMLKDSDDTSYVQRLRDINQKHLKLAEKQKDREMKGFSFKPEIRQAPTFVKHMAESHRLLRAQREKENCISAADDKPGWK